MHEFYNKIDIYVSTSLSDGGLSSVIAEAMSFERVVLSQIIQIIVYGLKIKKMDICLIIKNAVKLGKIIEHISKNKNKEYLSRQISKKDNRT